MLRSLLHLLQDKYMTKFEDDKKSINEFIGEFKKTFEFDLVDGELVRTGNKVEFKAVRNSDGLTLVSDGWVDPTEPALEINADDYLKLASLKAGADKPSKGVIKGLLTLMKDKR